MNTNEQAWLCEHDIVLHRERETILLAASEPLLGNNTRSRLTETRAFVPLVLQALTYTPTTL